MAKNPNDPSDSEGKQLAAVQDEGNDNSSAETNEGNWDRVRVNAREEESSEETTIHRDLWMDAVEQKNSSELLRLLTENAGELLWKYDKRGRTALHVAAMQGDRCLTESVLDQLWKVRQEAYYDQVWDGTLGDYIEDVDADSGKTAMELAKENVTDESSKAICNYIEVILRRSEAHNVIDTDVEAIEEGFDYLEYKVGTDAKAWMRVSMLWIDAIRNRDCTILLKVLEYRGTILNSEFEYWIWDYSGRSGLHVAAMQGCFPLAREILDIAKEESNRDYIEAVDLESGLTALQMADDIIGNRSIAEYIKFTLQLLENEDYVYPCFFEAYPLTQWCRALATENSRVLKRLLRINTRLVLETYKGLTVLHWAIIRNDKDLVTMLIELFGNAKEVEWGADSYFPPKLTWKHMFEKEIPSGDYNLGLTYSPNFEFEALVKDGAFTGSAAQLAGLVKSNFDNDSEIETRLIGYQGRSKVESPDRLPPHLPEDDLGILELTRLIDGKWNRKWNRGLLADVDFNFEAPLFDRRDRESIENIDFERSRRLSLFRLYYASKHPLVFEDFLESVLDRSIDSLNASTFVNDAQGRTLFHMMDHQGIFAGRVIGRIFDTPLDAKGRTLSDIVLIKHYLQYNTSLLDLGRNYGYDPTRDDNYAISFMFFQIATFLKQTTIAQHIWSEILERDIEEWKLSLRKSKSLPFIVASAGNQTMLQLLLEAKVDLTLIDNDGRTLLHHAANATLFDSTTLLELPMIWHCFSTVDDVCKVQRKWDEDRKKITVIFPSRESQTHSDVEKLETQVNAERKACILMLLQAGVDLSQEDKGKNLPNIGPTNDAMYISWWYDMVVKDTTDKKNSFNQAGNALSVVGALVAGTSYIGPLQPPMNYTQPDGFIHIGEKLVEVFMVTNTLAFYLALASVMFAVVPLLPMPQESLFSELKRAQYTVSFSLCLLLMSIVFIIISFAAASTVVIQDQHPFSKSGLLTFPTIIGLFVCVIAIISYLKRLMRLIFYNNVIVRTMYRFSFIK